VTVPEVVLVLAQNHQRYTEWVRAQRAVRPTVYREVRGLRDLMGRDGGRCVALYDWEESRAPEQIEAILATLKACGIELVSG
jgi:hypothetical protein